MWGVKAESEPKFFFRIVFHKVVMSLDLDMKLPSGFVNINSDLGLATACPRCKKSSRIETSSSGSFTSITAPQLPGIRK
jgi:hypothetical protein